MPTTERLWSWRWENRLPIAIGAIAVALSLFLAGVSWLVQSLVHEASATLFRGQATAFATAFTSGMDGPPSSETLRSFVDKHRSEGLRYMALWRPDAGIEVAAGEPIAPIDDTVAARLAREVPEIVGDRVRVKFGPPLRDPRRAGRPPGYGMPDDAGSGAVRPRPGGPDGAMPPPPRRGEGGRPPQDGRPWPPPPPRGGQMQPMMVFEFEPLHARHLVGMSKLSFTTGLVAVPVVFGGAMLLAFLVRRQTELTERLEHGKRLSALGEMAAVIAHEIRNPLTALKGHAQLLKKSLGGDPRDEKAGRVVGEAIRLENLLNDLLEFSRSGAIETRPVDPSILLRESVEQVAADRIVLHADRAPDSWPIDAPRFQQALTNILRNAVQVSPDDAPVEASVYSDNGHLVFEVRDRGPGLPPGEEKRIFEPFYTRKARGTGLGLALAQRIVAQHRGTITAGNDPKGGAVFRISLDK